MTEIRSTLNLCAWVLLLALQGCNASLSGSSSSAGKKSTASEGEVDGDEGVSEGTGDGSGHSSNTAVLPAGKSAGIESPGVGLVNIDEGTFSQDVVVTLSQTSSNDLIKSSELESADLLIGEVISISIEGIDKAKVFPVLPIQFGVSLGSSTSLPNEYFILIMGKNESGETILNYMSKDMLSSDVNAEDETIISVAKLLSASFVTAVVKGNPNTVLSSTILPLNSDGSLNDGTNATAAPTVAATSVEFTDSDMDGGEITGSFAITRASPETGITSYVLYWGDSATEKLANQNSIAEVEVTSGTGQLSYYFVANNAVPIGATHILTFSKNSIGEMTTPRSLALIDLGVPTNAAASVSFTDSDATGGEITGTFTISRALSESDLTHYVMYWGSSATQKLAGYNAIETYAKTGNNIDHSFAANAQVPLGASYILVFTKNDDGEMNSPRAYEIDDLGVPKFSAISLSFTDSDPDGGQVQGTVTISRASNETNITEYVVYFGSNATTKSGGSRETIAKGDANTDPTLTHTIAANTSLSGATHILVYTKNAQGEMATPRAMAITDLGVPTNASQGVTFNDIDFDAQQLAGTVTVSAATIASDITHYVLYWGSATTTKQDTTPIASLAKTGALTHTFVTNTPKPVAATHLLVYTKNADGEMATGVNVEIIDKGASTHIAQSMSFIDSNTAGASITGTLTFTGASNDDNITHYTLYWGSNTTTKQSGTAVGTVAVNASLQFTFSSTTVPSGATHFLLYSKYSDGESATALAIAIDDIGPPTNAAVGLSFTDTDQSPRQIADYLNITAPADISDLSHYVLYWGTDATTKQGAFIAEIAKATSPLRHNFSANTAIPSGATHLLVFTKNGYAEMTTGINIAINDQFTGPAYNAASLSFTDTDLDGGQVQGSVIINRASSETGISDYVVYFGSDATTKSGSARETIAKGDPNTDPTLTHMIDANTSLSGATHILVYSKNATDEYFDGPTSISITDKSIPTSAPTNVDFTDGDTDANQLSGNLTFNKAADETSITHYRIYLSSNATTYNSTTAKFFADVAKTGFDITYSVPADTSVAATTADSGAALTPLHFLVVSKNSDGAMTTGGSKTWSDVAGSPCGGNSVGGGCWYLAASNQSCGGFCTGKGGDSSATNADYTTCQNVVDSIVGTGHTVQLEVIPGCALGQPLRCFVSSGTYYLCASENAGSGAAHGSAQRFCACNN